MWLTCSPWNSTGSIIWPYKSTWKVYYFHLSENQPQVQESSVPDCNFRAAASLKYATGKIWGYACSRQWQYQCFNSLFNLSPCILEVITLKFTYSQSGTEQKCFWKLYLRMNNIKYPCKVPKLYARTFQGSTGPILQLLEGMWCPKFDLQTLFKVSSTLHSEWKW